MGPGVNNYDLFSVKCLCKSFIIAYICVTTRYIVFIFGTRYIYSLSLDMECVSDVPTPLSAARGKKLRLRQICVQVKVLRQTFLIAYISVTTVSFLS